MRFPGITGLSSVEVEQQRFVYGSNSLPPPKIESFWSKLRENFNDPLIKLLCVALVITMILAWFGFANWSEGIGIAVSVFIATFIATFSEHKNESSFQKLQLQANTIQAMVFRNSNLEKIDVNDIVVGDCVLLQVANRVPADGTIILGSVVVDQSPLTGENEPCFKTKAPKNYIVKENDFAAPHQCFRESLVQQGEAVMRVDSVGTNTIQGKLSVDLSTDEQPKAPLQIKLGKLADIIAKLAYVGALLIAISFLYKQLLLDQDYSKERLKEYVANWPVLLQDFITCVTLAIIIVVVAVPEGLPMMIALVLSLNMRKLLQSNVLVRRLVGIETSGCLEMLFVDKTGTLTEGVFVPKCFLCGHSEMYHNLDCVPRSLKNILSVGIRLSTSALASNNDRDSNEMSIVGGNATDRALLSFLGNEALIKDKNILIEDEILFDSAYKFSSVQLRSTDVSNKSKIFNQNGNITLVKGAPEIIISACTFCYDKYGKRIKFSEDKEDLIHLVNRLSNEGSRILALATSNQNIHTFYPCNISRHDISPTLPTKMTLIGVLQISDTIRSTTKEAIQIAKRAGIHVVMVTGDKVGTATAVAHDIGLLSDSDNVKETVITSSELSRMTSKEIEDKVASFRVVARALPSDKGKLVMAARKKGFVVGMSGDGVNDIAGLRKADVGFSMGSGTDIAKEVSDIIILDDNFKSILQCVLYGRTIFKSIRKFIIFQSTINLASTVIVFLGPFIGFDFPLTLIQLLWLNLVMDTFAGLAFGGEPAMDFFMDEKPVSRHVPIISKDMWCSIIMNGFFIALSSILFLTWDPILDQFNRFSIPEISIDPGDDNLARHENIVEINEQGGSVFLSAFFSFFIFICTFNAFNVRSYSLNILAYLSQNILFVFIIALIIFLQVLFVHFGGSALRTVPLTKNEWCTVTALSLMILPFDFFRKIIWNFVKNTHFFRSKSKLKSNQTKMKNEHSQSDMLEMQKLLNNV